MKHVKSRTPTNGPRYRLHRQLDANKIQAENETKIKARQPKMYGSITEAMKGESKR